jgi:outer membrane receptor protein involved in Fe transport
VAAGTRVDKFGSLDKLVASPRLMAMWRPREGHSLRLSFNRAFRAPAILNNYLDLTIRGVEFPLGSVCLLAPTLCAQDPTLAQRTLGLGPRSVGTEIARRIAPSLGRLKEESVTAYELAYTATFGSGTTLGAAYYVNDTDDNINFVGDPALLAAAKLPAFYSSAYPPPGWPFPAALVDHPALRAALFDRLPATIAYLNIGPVRNRGLELSVEHTLTRGLRGALTYSWQADPQALTPEAGRAACPPGELSLAPHHRFGAGLRWDRARAFGSVSADYVGRTFWNDVLPQLGFEGFTSAYTLLNASIGLRWPASRGRQVTTVLKGTNLLDQEIRQHIFGDIQKIGLMAEVRLSF